MAKKKDKDFVKKMQGERIVTLLEQQICVAETVKVLRWLHECTKKDSVPILWRVTWSSIRIPARSTKSNKPYRGSNAFLLAFAGYSNPNYMTYNQAVESGGIVCSGEQSWPIVYWHFSEDKKDSKGNVVERGRPLFMRYYKVFNMSQCRALTIDDVRKWQEQTDSNHGRIKAGAKAKLKALKLTADSSEDDLKKAVKNAQKRWGKLTKKVQAELDAIANKKDHEPIKAAQKVHETYANNGGPKVKEDGSDPCYIPKLDKIRMPKIESFTSPEEYHAKRFHEEAHSTGHKDRLNRPEVVRDNINMGDHDYSREELVAEIASYMLCGECGIEHATEMNSLAYVRGWLSKLKDDVTIAYEAAQDAQKACDMIRGIKHDSVEQEAA